MKIFILLISLFSFTTSCNNKKDTEATTYIKFEKAKWQEKEADAYPYRDDMLRDLIDSINVKNISYDSLINLLGQPDRINEGHLYYNIHRKEVGGVTFGTKAFVIKLKPDSTVEWRKIYGG